jgi:LysM repeat protein
MIPVSPTGKAPQSPSKIPAADTHVVKRGETLSGIAKEHGVGLQKLIAANPQIENPNLILVGQHITVPSKARKAAPAAEPAEPRKPAHKNVQQGARQTASQGGAAARGRVEGDLPAAHQPAPAKPAKAPPQAPAATQGKQPAQAIRSTKGMSEAQKYDYFRGLVESHGGKFHNAPNARNIVGLRHETSPNSHGGQGANDDTFATLWVDKSGHKHVKEYTGSTEGIGANRRDYSSDVNGDHNPDLGRVPPGYYEYAPSYSNRLGNVLRPTHGFQVERDYNHDGKFTGKEQHADTSNAFLFHEGSSAGCQTMPNGTWDRFWTDINSSGRPSRVGYTLIDVNGK